MPELRATFPRHDAAPGNSCPEISATLKEMRTLTEELRVSGSYRADREGGTAVRTM